MDTLKKRKTAAMEEHAVERESDNGFNSTADDRISQLPEAILHHILYYLPQEEAAQTCVLSKAWRHLWSTRPKFQFCESRFKQTFFSVFYRTLQGYHDQKLCIQDLCVSMKLDFESVSLLKNWIPIVLLNMGVKKFSLYLNSTNSWTFDLSSVLFEAESLQYLSLGGCNLNKMDPDKKVLFKHLKTLYLSEVHIEEEIFQKIISSCPLIEDMELYCCEGLRTVKLINDNQQLCNLKNFAFTHYKSCTLREDDYNSFEINVPALETVRIADSAKWFLDHHMFPNLKSLDLSAMPMGLSRKLLDKLSFNFPLLERLTISYFYGFRKFKLSSHSIKYFSLVHHWHKSIKPAGTIDAPHMHTFEFSGYLPPSISFTTTYGEWNSNIFLDFDVDSDDDASAWFHN